MAAHSPSSSPRLPSPPPIAEDQLGPASPGVSLFEDHGKLPGSGTDTGASRRIRPGTKAEDMAEGPPLVELQDIDSPFPLTEHLKALHHHYTHPPDSTALNPIDSTLAQQLAQPPPNTSKEIWLYELARFLIQKTNAIIVALFADSPSCSAATCPEMRASEWQYLCAVHDPPKSCSAIDYCCHTLDWAATTLTSSKMFPSRLGLGSGSGNIGSDKVLNQQMKEITNIFRRVYRIYAHAWFQHREMFWRVEGRSGLYVFFKTVCDEYGLIQPENYTIPPEAEGLEPEEPIKRETAEAPSVLRRDEPTLMQRQGEEGADRQEPVGNTILAAGDTTKRHRHTRSDHSVQTVIQEEEEEEEPQPPPPSMLPQHQETEQEKPDLVRQTTKLKEIAESLPQPGHKDSDQGGGESALAAPETEPETQQAEEEEEPPILGVHRSDTVKPPKPAEAEEEKGEEDGDKTTVEPGVEAKDEGEKVEAMDPSEAPAADGEEAGKSVAD